MTTRLQEEATTPAAPFAGSTTPAMNDSKSGVSSIVCSANRYSAANLLGRLHIHTAAPGIRAPVSLKRQADQGGQLANSYVR